MFTITWAITVLIVLMTIGIIIFAVYTILNMLPIPEPIKTLIWLLVALIFLVWILSATNLYHLSVALLV